MTTGNIDKRSIETTRRGADGFVYLFITLRFFQRVLQNVRNNGLLS